MDSTTKLVSRLTVNLEDGTFSISLEDSVAPSGDARIRVVACYPNRDPFEWSLCLDRETTITQALLALSDILPKSRGW